VVVPVPGTGLLAFVALTGAGGGTLVQKTNSDYM
jgi:hypothetical protein